MQDDRDEVLIIAWPSPRCESPYPVLELVGEQGWPSLHAAMLRALVDPNTVALRARRATTATPTSLRLMGTSLPSAICRQCRRGSRTPSGLSTGGGFATGSSTATPKRCSSMRPII